MAVIGKIQKNSLLLLIVIGLAMLAFIFTEAMRSWDDSDREIIDLATIWGEPINEDDYYELREQFIERDKAQAAQTQQEFTEQMEDQAEDQAFNEVVRRALMNTEFEKLGITCTTDELNDMIHGNHIHPWVAQIPLFQNPMTGEFERDSVRVFINNLEVEPDNEEQRARWLDARNQWKMFEDELKDNRKAEKYVTMIKKGMFVNTLEAKDFYEGNEEKKQISFVIQRFTELRPDEWEVTDEEIKAYYEEHKDEPQYEMEESRDVDFVTFPIVATQLDKESVMATLSEITQPFQDSKNTAAFVAQHTENEFFSDSAEFRMGSTQFSFNQFMGNEYPASLDDAVQESKVGDVLGPIEYLDQQTATEYVAIAKVTGANTELQSWVRHILIKIDDNRSEAAAKSMSDSIISIINEKDNFVQMVTKHSEDPGSIENGGEYKWFPEGRMVTEFNDAAFNGEIGKLQLVKTTYGYHIVEVLGRGERVLPKLAVIAKKVEPSEESIRDMESLVYDFIYGVADSKKDSAFHSMAKDSGVTVQSTRVWMEQKFVMGMTDEIEFLRFAFGKNAQEGDVSDPIFDGDKYVVAYLSNVIEEGTPEFQDVKEMMRNPARQKKQSDHYVKLMSGKKSLDAVAKETTNGQILDAEIMFSSNTIQGGGGNEPEVIGNLFTDIPVGSMTKPIVGTTGIYVVVVNSVTKAPPTSDYMQPRGDLLVGRAGSADGNVMKALREKADVQDNRRKREIRQ